MLLSSIASAAACRTVAVRAATSRARVWARVWVHASVLRVPRLSFAVGCRSQVRSGAPEAEQAVIQTSALQHGMRLFAAFPFNNLLHHSVAAMLQSCVASETLSTYLIEECGVLDWIVGLPTTVVPPPVPGDEAHAASKAPLRAGYLGHVTQIAGHLAAAGPTGSAGSSGDDGGEGDGDGAGRLSKYTRVHERWCQYVEDVLQPRQVRAGCERGWCCLSCQYIRGNMCNM